MNELRRLFEESKKARTLANNHPKIAEWSYNEIKRFADIEGLYYCGVKNRFTYKRYMVYDVITVTWECLGTPKKNLDMAQKLHERFVEDMVNYRNMMSENLLAVRDGRRPITYRKATPEELRRHS